VEDRVKRAKELMGARIDKLREQAGLSKTQLSIDSGVDRTYLHDILSGDGNPTLEQYAKLASACGVDFEEFLGGIDPDAQPQAHQAFYRMLKSILTSGVKELTDALYVNLEALSEKAGRIKKARESPHPRSREEGGAKAARGGHKSSPRRQAS